ncbi:hypothetical protein AVEN_144273-1 [Araneus ventricosus]|uniref:Uncharacterized protein n=1 Tax=Araneus ventricosus TaxID=182803 RepID=A0A4Y2H7G5_ARAVE|nr:hypothetical protein AVEN_144273-1 [Araneus ventricosus]
MGSEFSFGSDFFFYLKKKLRLSKHLQAEERFLKLSLQMLSSLQDSRGKKEDIRGKNEDTRGKKEDIRGKNEDTPGNKEDTPEIMP